MSAGALTTELARVLHQELAPHGLAVLYAHGQKATASFASFGKPRVWFGSRYARCALLADLDIAVVDRADRLIALIEVEETTAKPKVLLGDALAPLLGDRVRFPDGQDRPVGPWTTLIVLARLGATNGPAQRDRLAFLEEQVNTLKPQLTAPNAAVGRVVIAGFVGEAELIDQAKRLVHTARRAAAPTP